MTTTAHLAAVRLKSANKYIFRALLSLASANLLIRIFGLLNQVVITASFGQGATMDAYYVATLLPTTLAQLLASGLEASMIPVYSRVLVKEGRKKASRLFSTLLNLLFLGLLAFTIILLLLRNQMIFLSAPALASYSQQLAANLTPLVFPVLLFMSLNSFMECLLNSEGQFGWPAYAGILVPLTTVTFVLLGAHSTGVVMLCAGTLVGQVFQLGVILIRARRAKLVYQPILDLHNPELAAIAT
jgi:putative peptidoglycan lipid II flippase